MPVADAGPLPDRPAKSLWRMFPVVAVVVMGIALGVQFTLRLRGQPTCQDLAPFGARFENGACVVAGDLMIEDYKDRQGGRYPRKRLPDRLTVKGNLTVKGDALTELPANLTVSGNIMLHKTSIDHLPADLHVAGSVDTEHGWGSGSLPCRNVPKTAVIGGGVRCDP